MLVYTCILLFVIFACPKFIETKKEHNRSVNLALETVVEFRNKDRAGDIQFLDNVAQFISNVKKAISPDSTPQRAFRATKVDTFTGFAQEFLETLQSYEDADLQDFFDIFNKEIRKYHYRGCKFHELLENYDLRQFVDTKLNELIDKPVAVRKKLKVITKVLQNQLYDKPFKELMDYIDSLYMYNSKNKFVDVLNNLDVFKDSKASKHTSNLVDIVKDGIRAIIFDHYTQLNHNARRELKDKVESLWKQHKITPISFNVASVNQKSDKKTNKVNKHKKVPSEPKFYKAIETPIKEKELEKIPKEINDKRQVVTSSKNQTKKHKNKLSKSKKRLVKADLDAEIVKASEELAMTKITLSTTPKQSKKELKNEDEPKSKKFPSGAVARLKSKLEQKYISLYEAATTKKYKKSHKKKKTGDRLLINNSKVHSSKSLRHVSQLVEEVSETPFRKRSEHNTRHKDKKTRKHKSHHKKHDSKPIETINHHSDDETDRELNDGKSKNDASESRTGIEHKDKKHKKKHMRDNSELKKQRKHKVRAHKPHLVLKSSSEYFSDSQIEDNNKILALTKDSSDSSKERRSRKRMTRDYETTLSANPLVHRNNVPTDRTRNVLPANPLVAPKNSSSLRIHNSLPANPLISYKNFASYSIHNTLDANPLVANPISSLKNKPKEHKLLKSFYQSRKQANSPVIDEDVIRKIKDIERELRDVKSRLKEGKRVKDLKEKKGKYKKGKEHRSSGRTYRELTSKEFRLNRDVHFRQNSDDENANQSLNDDEIKKPERLYDVDVTKAVIDNTNNTNDKTINITETIDLKPDDLEVADVNGDTSKIRPEVPTLNNYDEVDEWGETLKTQSKRSTENPSTVESTTNETPETTSTTPTDINTESTTKILVFIPVSIPVKARTTFNPSKMVKNSKLEVSLSTIPLKFKATTNRIDKNENFDKKMKLQQEINDNFNTSTVENDKTAQNLTESEKFTLISEDSDEIRRGLQLTSTPTLQKMNASNVTNNLVN